QETFPKMPISRLLLPKHGGPNFHARGLTQSTKWCSFSSSSSSSGSKKSSFLEGLKPAKKGTAVDKESKKMLLAKSKSIDSFLHPHARWQWKKKGPGGRGCTYIERTSWVKGILTNIKQTILVSSQFQEPILRETSDSEVDMTASEVTMTLNFLSRKMCFSCRKSQ
ncbi:hypothetical protein QQP08_014575, partial [Theobroma cacao]